MTTGKHTRIRIAEHRHSGKKECQDAVEVSLISIRRSECIERLALCLRMRGLCKTS